MFSKIQNILQEHIDNIMGVGAEIQQQDSTLFKSFKLPIQYLDEDVYKLNDIVIEDLELNVKGCEDECKTESMYDNLFTPENIFSQNMVENSNVFYTTNVEYLQDTQRVIKNMNQIHPVIDFSYNDNYKDFMVLWKETKEMPHFLEKYSFMDWSMFKYLNNSSFFLQFLSIINMSSPVLSLVLPLLFMIFPFLILKFQGIPITFSTYLDVLKTIAKNHFIGKMMNVNKYDFSTMIYLLFTLGFYCLQIYQNINACMRFYQNIKQVNTHLCNMKSYLGSTISSMQTFCDVNGNIPHYRDFCESTQQNCYLLQELLKLLQPIVPFTPGFSKITEIGYLLKVFYIIHDDANFGESLKYSVGFNGYLHHLFGIYENIQNNHISFAEFKTDNSKTEFLEQYYPKYVDSEHVNNDISVSKNIITGPNASGKTTLLKTTTINIIFTQQYGVGFYKACRINPYHYIHSYLNIPDTSGRDSLFQAESRRCKEIIDTIQSSSEKRHFTIFDELFSGTNPGEATKSAYAFLLYLSKYENVDFILTTHYTSVCKRLGKTKTVRNYKMDVEFDSSGNIIYSYKVKRGISKIQGAIIVLEEMNYPSEIIDTIKKYT
jgi:hypothetical protein